MVVREMKPDARAAFTTSSPEMILSEPQMEIWHETKDRIISGMDGKRHRASYDALVIQQTWAETWRSMAR